MSIEIKTVNGQKITLEAYRVVAYEEADARAASTRIFLEAGHVILVKMPYAQFAEAMASSFVAETAPGHPVIDELPEEATEIVPESVAATTVTEAPTPPGTVNPGAPDVKGLMDRMRGVKEEF